MSPDKFRVILLLLVTPLNRVRLLEPENIAVLNFEGRKNKVQCGSASCD